MLTIHPKYAGLRQWLEQLPQRFETEGEVIYDARNQIRLMNARTDTEDKGLPVCVKRFHQPRFINRLIYSTLRKSKARRSYENGLYLLQHGVGTPEPIAYLEERQFGLLGFSYLVTLPSSLTRLHREFTLAYTPALDETIQPLARFTAHMHNEGILHLDFSPGNILWDQINGEYRFEVIDINRMRFGEVSIREGCHSLRRICARRSFFDTFADEYAAARGFDKEECRYWIHYYRNRFWNYGKKANYDYD